MFEPISPSITCFYQPNRSAASGSGRVRAFKVVQGCSQILCELYINVKHSVTQNLIKGFATRFHG